MGIHGSQGLSVDSILRELRQRADEDFLTPRRDHEAGRHQVDLDDLELRVSCTRSRYPNTPDGVDSYAVTISRPQMDHAPEEAQTRRVLYALFGDNAEQIEERPGGGPLVRMFRVPVRAVQTTEPPAPENPGQGPGRFGIKSDDEGVTPR